MSQNSGTPAWDTFTPGCGVPVDEYFWLNSLHPTYPMHEVVAQEMDHPLRTDGDGAGLGRVVERRFGSVEGVDCGIVVHQRVFDVIHLRRLIISIGHHDIVRVAGEWLFGAQIGWEVIWRGALW